MGVDLESLSEATSGAIGSLLSTTILYPLDTCKTKYQAEVRAHGTQKYRLPISSVLNLWVLLSFLNVICRFLIWPCTSFFFPCDHGSILFILVNLIRYFLFWFYSFLMASLCMFNLLLWNDRNWVLTLFLIVLIICLGGGWMNSSMR